MRLTGAEGRTLAAAAAAGMAMLLCFAGRNAAMTALDRLPYDPPAVVRVEGEGLVDINAAGKDELMSLPGIGQARAQAILDDRAANGPYRYPEDLLRVKGIGVGILEDILDQITTGGDENAQDFGG